MSYAGFCEVCGVPYCEADAIQHQHGEAEQANAEVNKKFAPQIEALRKEIERAEAGSMRPEHLYQTDYSRPYPGVHEANIPCGVCGIQRMDHWQPVEGTRPEMPPAREPRWPSLDPESGDFTDGWNQAINLCRTAFKEWLAASVQQEPLSAEHKLTWSEETMQIINKLTPDIKGKAFDIEWFLLRQRFEEFEYKANHSVAAAIAAHLPPMSASLDSAMLAVIDERDKWEEKLGDLAVLAGCEEEWSNLHEHGDCIAEEIHRLRSGSNYVANDVVFPTEITFTNGRIVRISFDEFEKKNFLVIDMNPAATDEEK